MEQTVSADTEKLAQINALFNQNRLTSLFENPEVLKTIVVKAKELSLAGKKEIIQRLLYKRKNVADITDLNARNYEASTPYNVIYKDKINANRQAIGAAMAIVFQNSLATAQELYRVVQSHLDSETFLNVRGSNVCTIITNYEGKSDVYGEDAYKAFKDKVFQQFQSLRSQEASFETEKSGDKSVASDIDEGLVSVNPDEQEKVAAPSSKETSLTDLETVKEMVELDLLSPEQLAQLSNLLSQIKQDNAGKLVAPTDDQNKALGA
jgi:hypothetical protein